MIINRLATLPALAIILLRNIGISSAYPILFEAVKNDRVCMDLNIPDGDDATLLLLPLPEDVKPEVEDWFYTELTEMTRPTAVQFLKDLSKIPKDISQHINHKKSRSKVNVNVEEEETKTLAMNQALTYFRPTIIKDVAKSGGAWEVTRGNYRICIHSRGSESVRVIYDVVRVSEYKEKNERRHVVKKEHLTPLERAFDDSSALAKSIIDEMHYMEKREIRMKKTADATNSRIKWFSYVSIIILIGITWFQMTHLKGYFRKKKIL